MFVRFFIWQTFIIWALVLWIVDVCAVPHTYAELWPMNLYWFGRLRASHVHTPTFGGTCNEISSRELYNHCDIAIITVSTGKMSRYEYSISDSTMMVTVSTERSCHTQSTTLLGIEKRNENWFLGFSRFSLFTIYSYRNRIIHSLETEKSNNKKTQ